MASGTSRKCHKRPWRYVEPTTEMQAKTNLKEIIRQAGVAMWSRLLALALACALLLLPARALAGAKEEVAALAGCDSLGSVTGANRLDL